MSAALTFTTASERVATLVASLLFLVPGTAGVIVGFFTLFGLSFIDNASNGVLLVITGGIWALVGLALLRFKRWITVDPGAGTVVQGTRTLFKHPGERHSLDAFSRVHVLEQRVQDQVFYVVALAWEPGKRPRSRAHEEALWLQTTASLDEARELGAKVAGTVDRPLVDQTKGQKGAS